MTTRYNSTWKIANEILLVTNLGTENFFVILLIKELYQTLGSWRFRFLFFFLPPRGWCCWPVSKISIGGGLRAAGTKTGV